MKILVYSEVNAEAIANSIWLSKHSYYSVLRELLPVLKSMGSVEIVTDPAQEVDKQYAMSRAVGERCVFLSFTPPHKTPMGLKCPTIPLLAWAFDTIPNEHWLSDRKQDWRYGLERCGCAITHSEMAVAAIREQMGDNYPVVSIPAPVWDKYVTLRERLSSQRRRESLMLSMASCVMFDSHDASMSRHWPSWHDISTSVAQARGEACLNSGPKPQAPTVRQQSLPRITFRYLVEWYRLVGRGLLRQSLQGTSEQPTVLLEPIPSKLQAEAWQPRSQQLELSGVVFTSVFNPGRSRKNWADMLTAFCIAFRDCHDATLVFKLSGTEYQREMNEMLLCLARLPKFSCRVVLLHGFLDDETFETLIEASHFVVNASFDEGQCLPLMEFLSCGRPAVAPRNSAMLDYIDSQVGFVVEGWSDTAIWPHDPREAYRSLRQQINWESLVEAYSNAYLCLRQTPERYADLSRNAIERMNKYCSRQTAERILKNFLSIGDLQ